MKRTLLCFAAALLALTLSAPPASAFGWKDVIQMHEAGLADSLILQKIEYSGTTFRLSADDMEALKEAGVSDAVISAMLRTEAEDEPAYDDRYHRYYDGYYDHPRRVYFGFGLGYYGHYPRYYDRWWYPRHGGYYGRAYYPSRYRYYFRRHLGALDRTGRPPGPAPTRYRTRVRTR